MRSPRLHSPARRSLLQAAANSAGLRWTPDAPLPRQHTQNAWRRAPARLPATCTRETGPGSAHSAAIPGPRCATHQHAPSLSSQNARRASPSHVALQSYTAPPFGPHHLPRQPPAAALRVQLHRCVKDVELRRLEASEIVACLDLREGVSEAHLRSGATRRTAFMSGPSASSGSFPPSSWAIAVRALMR